MAALLVATASGCRDAKQYQSQPLPKSSVAVAGGGHKWRLTQVKITGRTVDVPDSIDATLQLTSDGQFLASDSVNALSGTYTGTPTGFRVTSTGTTLVGYAGTDPTTEAVIAAIDVVARDQTVVAAKTTGTTLTLNVSNYELIFREGGPAVSYPPPSATATVTPMRS
jgi:hypothetical protein